MYFLSREELILPTRRHTSGIMTCSYGYPLTCRLYSVPPDPFNVGMIACDMAADDAFIVYAVVNELGERVSRVSTYFSTGDLNHLAGR